MARSGMRVVVVTGAGSGIGRATAQLMAGDGTLVVACDIDGKSAEETAQSVVGDAMVVEMDVASHESVSAAVRRIGESVHCIDVVVNNAGVSIPGEAHVVSEAVWDAGFAVNVKGVYLVSKAAWPYLVNSKSGVIINTASISGLWAGPADAAYCASKAAVIMLTKCMALDGASSGIRVNCVCPGWTQTPMVDRLLSRSSRPEDAREAARKEHPLGRLGEPQDIASAIDYLASEHASWVTGATLVVDGGLTTGLKPGWMPQ